MLETLANDCYLGKQPFAVILADSLCVTSAPIVDVLAACLRHYMAERGLTQQALAAKSGVAQTTISLYMRPKARGDTATGRAGSPTLANVEALAGALGVEVWELLRPVNQAERELFRAVSKLAAGVHSPTPPAHPRASSPQPAARSPQPAPPPVASWERMKAEYAEQVAQWHEWITSFQENGAAPRPPPDNDH